MSPLLPDVKQLEQSVLVVPVGGSVLIRRAVADFKPNYLFIAVPQDVSEDVVSGVSQDVDAFARSIGLNMGIDRVPIPGALGDAVIAVRRAVVARKGFPLTVNIALLDDAPNWLNVVLYSTAPIIKALVYEGISLGAIRYYTLNETRDVVEPLRIPITDLGGEAYTVLKLMAKVKGAVSADVINAMFNETGNKVSKRYILKLLDRLIEAELVERIGSGNMYLYRLTPLGELLVG
jgi:DNA-binding transcriptional ArsR family regulator